MTLDNKTLDFLDELRRKSGQAIPDPADQEIPSNPNMSTLQAVGTVMFGPPLKGAGYMLTKALSGLSALTTFIPSLIHQLETNTNIYDKAWGMQEDGTYKNPGQFNPAGLASGLGDAVSAAFQNSVRTAQSKNLNELAINPVSGAEVLKNLPGELGESFRRTDRASQIATAVLGFGLEVLLDPTAKIAQGVRHGVKVGSKVVGGATKLASGLGASDKVADITGRLAANIATGNVIAGPIAMGLREASDAYRNRLINVAMNATDRRKAISAQTTLEWLYGPMSMARDEFKPLANQLVSLKQELPKFMLKASGLSAMAVAGLPAKSASEARELFAVVATNPRTSELSTKAIDRLLELGVKKEHIDAVGSTFYEANRKLISFLEEGRGVIQGMDKPLYTVDHLREVYYINADRRSRQNWLHFLMSRNTPGSWQIHNLGIRQRLEERLGIATVKDLSKVPNAVIANNAHKLDLRTDKGTRAVLATTKTGVDEVADVAFPTPSNVVTEVDIKAAAPFDTGNKLSEQFPANYARRIVEARKKQHAKITAQIEQLDALIYKQVPAGSEDIGRSSGLMKPQTQALIERRNKLIAAQELIESRMDDVNILDKDVGIPPKSVKLLTEKLEPDLGPPNELVGTPAAAMKSKVTKPSVIPEEDVFTPEQRKDYVEALIQFANKDRLANDATPKLFAYNPDHSPKVRFEAEKSDARRQTLEDLIAFTDNYLDNLPVTPSQSVRAELHKALDEAIAYVPGDVEFVRGHGLKAAKDVVKDAGTWSKYLIDAGYVTTAGADTAVIAEPYVDEIFKPLLGPIKEFTARAAIQAELVSDLAADVHVYSEMKKRGLVLTAKQIQELPEGQRHMWRPVDNIYQRGADGEQLFAHEMDLATINAINRALSSEVKIPQAIQWASQLFKRNALLYYPASHMTQWLGNIALLKAAGYGNLVGDEAKFAKDIRRVWTSMLSADELFEDAIRSGVTVSASLADNATANNLLRRHLTQPKTDDLKGTLSGIFNGIHTLVSGGGMAAIKGATLASEAMGASTVQAFDNASHKLSAGALYSTSDQLLRLYVYKHEVEKALKPIIDSNPQLKGWLKKDAPLLDIDSLVKYHESSAGKTAPIFDAERLETIKEAYRQIRENAAMVANDVGLNMADVPRLATYLSRSGVVPFVNFQMKSVGRTLRWMDETPWVFTPYFTLQRNANQTFNDNPEDFESDVATLPEHVRGGLIIPTNERNSQGYPIYMDLARWSPFGMFLGQNTGFGTDKFQQPNSLVSMPIGEVVSRLLTEEGREPGQSFPAFAAATLARTYGIAGIGPGSPQIDALAKAIERTTFSVDEEGNVHPREPSSLEKALVAYNNIPKRIGEVFDFKDTGTATGNPKPNVALRNRTTPEVAATRIFVPGYGYAPDKELTVAEIMKKADIAINKLEREIASYNNRPHLTAADGQRIQQLQERIMLIEAQRSRAIDKLRIGE